MFWGRGCQGKAIHWLNIKKQKKLKILSINNKGWGEREGGGAQVTKIELMLFMDGL